MKPRLFLFLLVGIISPMVFSQTPTSDELYQSEVNKMVTIPSSPEAASFAQYGNVPTNLYSGTPEINLPLHIFKGREMDLPMTLTYDASGVKVEAMASWIGLNWNLNVGGRVTRVVNGLPDDYFSGGSYQTINSTSVSAKINQYLTNNARFATVQEARDYFTFLQDINTNFIDAEPDYFILNAPGIQGTIIMDITDGNNFKVLNNPRIKVEVVTTQSGTPGVYHPIESWKVTKDDGTVYWFGAKERTKVQGSDTGISGAISYEYTSSWLLTKMESRNKRDVYDFNYTASSYWLNDQLSSSAVATVTQILPQQQNYPSPNSQFNGSALYWISQQYLSSIVNKGETLATFTMGNRYDVNSSLTSSRLEEIALLDFSGLPLRYIEFYNDDYFNLDGQSPSQKDRKDIRLKLNGLGVKGKDQNVYQAYAFEYDRPDELPSRMSKSQDYYGYYNGASNNVLYPSYTMLDGKFLEGADRSPNGNYAKIGTLTKITYPTNGYSEFEFGEHEIYQPGSTQSTEFMLQIGVNSSTVADPSLYYNDSGVACDDAFEGGSLPKVKLATFTIPEGNDVYTIEYTGDTAEGAAFIQHFSGGCVTKPDGSIYCPPNPYGNYCDFYGVGGLTWSASTQPKTTTTTLEAGEYVALIILGPQNGGTFGSINLNVSREVTTATASNIPMGGIRIQRITDYASSGMVARSRVFSYENGSGQSTGVMNFTPSLVRLQNLDDANGNETTQVLRTAAFPTGDAPSITYKSVRETLLDRNGNQEGYTEHEFYNGLKGAVPRSSPPFENSYFPSLSVGNPKNIFIYNKDDQLVSQTGTTYFEGPEPTQEIPALTRGMVVTLDETLANQVVMLKSSINPITQVADVTYEILPKYNCSATPCVLRDYVMNPQAHGYLEALDGVSRLNMRATAAVGVYGGISNVVQTMRYGDLVNDPTEIVTDETTTYDPLVRYLPRKTEMTDSSGDTAEKTYYYPMDNTMGGSTDLVAKNDLVEILEEYTVRNPNGTKDTLSILKKEFYAVGNEIVVPTLIKTGKTSQAGIEDRIELGYYPDGSLRESKKVGGMNTFYIWGYKDMYPVAKIENATRTEIESIPGIGPNFKAVSGSLTASEENSLRNGLPNALITTYEYDVFVGVVKVTDPMGNSFVHEYDDFQRLLRVKDRNGNIVSDYDYKYATETQN